MRIAVTPSEATSCDAAVAVSGAAISVAHRPAAILTAYAPLVVVMRAPTGRASRSAAVSGGPVRMRWSAAASRRCCRHWS